MKKPLNKSAKKSESNTKLSFDFDFNKDGWNGPELWVRLIKDVPAEGNAGYRSALGQNRDPLWGAIIGEENSCCGFPVLLQFEENHGVEKHAKEIGKHLAKELEAHMVYLSAYVPETRDFAGTRAILEAAGFKPGVSLRSGHGKYHNVRWEWNADKHLYRKG